jgi:hypothetical protein
MVCMVQLNGECSLQPLSSSRFSSSCFQPKAHKYSRVHQDTQTHTHTHTCAGVRGSSGLGSAFFSGLISPSSFSCTYRSTLATGVRDEARVLTSDVLQRVPSFYAIVFHTLHRAQDC